MHGCLDSLGHRIPSGVNFCTNCGEVFSAKKSGKRSSGQKSADKAVRQLAAIVERQGGLCFYCEEPFEAIHPFHATRDHVVPKSRGGKGGRNLVAACAQCNTRKASMPLQAFLTRKRWAEAVSPSVVRFFRNMAEAFRSV
jgi:5-methylcytosine-specific restriction endonuclease McrA